MRILFLSTKGPLPTNDGHSLRTFNLLKQVATVHQIHLVSFVKFPEEYRYIEGMRHICQSVHYIRLWANISKVSFGWVLARSVGSREPFVALKYYQNEMRRTIQGILRSERIDLVHVDMLPVAVYLDYFLGIPVVLNAHNVETLLLARQVENERSAVKRFYLRAQQEKLQRFECMVANRVNHVITCSENDREGFTSFANGTPVTVVPNGVDVDYFSPSNVIEEVDDKIVFVGGLNWFPNVDGLKWFDEMVLPLIIRKRPAVRIHVIGRCEQNFVATHREHFLLEGLVPDIRPHLESASVVIVPLRVGGGTRLKILDAMSMSKAIVSTTVGAEGLGASDGANLVVRDDARDFAEGVIQLIENRAMRERIKYEAREFVMRSFQWADIGMRLRQVYETAIESSEWSRAS